MIIFCDYCGARCEINEHELDDWIVLDPESGDKRVMCPSCESDPTQRAADVAYQPPKEPVTASLVIPFSSMVRKPRRKRKSLARPGRSAGQ